MELFNKNTFYLALQKNVFRQITLSMCIVKSKAFALLFRLVFNANAQWTSNLWERFERACAKAIPKLAFTALFLLFANLADAQWMKIDRNGGNPVPSAALEISDTSRGLLPPRLTTTQMNAVSSPATGLMIYNTDSNKYFYYDSANWESLDGVSNNSDTLDENVFSARVNSSGTVDLESQDFISGVTKNSTGVYTVLFNTNFFNETPIVTVTTRTTSNSKASFFNESKDSVMVYTHQANTNALADRNFTIFVQRQGSDYRYNTSGASASALANASQDTLPLIKDADNDTKIQVEETADEDVIRFDAGGTEVMRLDNFSRLYLPNARQSLFVGLSAGGSINTGTQNTFLGYESGANNISGSGNTFMGYRAGYLATGSNNTVIGTVAGDAALSGFRNVLMGLQSGSALTSADDNLMLGYNAGRIASTGDKNTYLGSYAGETGNGSGNIMIGYTAGQNETGSNKLFIENSNATAPLIYGEFDNDSLRFNGAVSVKDGLFVDQGNASSGKVLTSDANGKATWQTLTAPVPAIMQDTDADTKIQMEESTDEDIIRFDLGGTEYFRMNKARLEPENSGFSVFVGEEAGLNDDYSNNHNAFVGYRSGRSTTTGNQNTALGSNSLYSSATGSNNIAIGYSAGWSIRGNNNTAVGSSALAQDTSGSFNTALGMGALGIHKNGSGNVAIGGLSLNRNEVGTGNIAIGQQSGYNELGSNKLYIENSLSATPLIYGDFATDSLRFNGAVRITDEFYVDSSNAAAGKVLTSFDGSGKATWQTPSSTAAVFDYNVGDQAIFSDSTDYDFVVGSTQLDDVGGTSGDSRMIFDKSVGAFRAGIADSTEWDSRDTGTAVLGGRNNSISAKYGVITGGIDNVVSSTYSVALGGQNNTVSGNTSIVGGWNNLASGKTSTAIGGYQNSATGDFSAALGGTGLYAPSAGEIAIGFWNTDYTPNSAVGINANDRLLVVGNGTNGGAGRKNALIIYKSGHTILNGRLWLSNGSDSIRLPNTDGTAGQVLQTNGSGNVTWQTPTSSPWALVNDTVSVSGKRVGIGTTGPEGALHVTTAANERFILDNSANDATLDLRAANAKDSRIRFRSGGANKFQVGYEDTYKRLTWAGPNWASALMRLDTLGKLGIGSNPIPAYHLDMYNDNDSTIYLRMAHAGTGISNGFQGLRIGYDQLNASILNYENGKLSFGNNGTTDMTIDSIGNVGIGESAPTERLEVAGAIAIQGSLKLNGNSQSQISNTTDANRRYLSLQADTGGGSNLFIYGNQDNAYPGALRFVTNGNWNNPKMIVDSSGNVGIGTTAPKAKLQIGTTTGLMTASGNAHITGNMYHDGNWRSINGGRGSFMNFAPGNGSIGFYTTDSVAADAIYAETQRMVITKDGNVGIGTTTPQAKLHINGALRFEGNADAQIDNFNTSGRNILRLFSDVGGTNSGGGISLFGGTDNLYPHQIRFYAGGSQNGVPRMMVDSAGRVGIGSDAPTARLEIKSNASQNTLLMKSWTNASPNIIYFDRARQNETTMSSNNTFAIIGGRGYDGANYIEGARITLSGDGTLGTNDMPGRIQFETTPDGSSSTVERMRIDNAGNVGIGTTAPKSKLTVADHITPDANNTYSLGTTVYRWNTVYATNGTINTSDRRLKTNIRDLEYGLEEVLSLKAKSFNWKESPNEQQKLGFMAQDLLEIIPEVVVIGEDSLETLGVHYSDLIPVLTKAIQEQQAIIENLKSENGTLKSEVENEKATNNSQKSEIEEINAKLEIIEQMLNEGRTEK